MTNISHNPLRDLQATIIGTLHDLLSLEEREQFPPTEEDIEAAKLLLKSLPKDDIIYKFYSSYLPENATADYRPEINDLKAALQLKSLPEYEKPLRRFLRALTKSKPIEKRKTLEKSKAGGFYPAWYFLIQAPSIESTDLIILSNQNYIPAKAKLGGIFLQNIMLHLEENIKLDNYTKKQKQFYFKLLRDALKTGNHYAKRIVDQFIKKFIEDSAKLMTHTLPDYHRNNLVFMGNIAIELLTEIKKVFENERSHGLRIRDCENIQMRIDELEVLVQLTPQQIQSTTAGLANFDDLFFQKECRQNHANHLSAYITKHYTSLQAANKNLHRAKHAPKHISPQTKKMRAPHKKRKMIFALAASIGIAALLTGMFIGIGVAGAGIGLTLAGTITPLGLVGLSLAAPPIIITLLNCGICAGIGFVAGLVTSLATSLFLSTSALIFAGINALLPKKKDKALTRLCKPEEEDVIESRAYVSALKSVNLAPRSNAMPQTEMTITAPITLLAEEPDPRHSRAARFGKRVFPMNVSSG